jgi:prepilin-type N-terminal cleavage/methylation domain-containing protein
MFAPRSDQSHHLENLRMTLLILWRSRQQTNRQSGVTLIEALVAVVVVSILVASIAPMVALSVASRVQARRFDLATEHARSYIEKLKADVLPVPQEYVAADICSLNSVPAPSSYPPLDLGTQVDTNNNGFSEADVQDLVIQAIRSPSTCTGLNCASTQGYQVLVRVYRADAFLNSNLPTGVEQSTNSFTGTLGSKDAPLVVQTSYITNNDTSADNYEEVLGGC